MLDLKPLIIMKYCLGWGPQNEGFGSQKDKEQWASATRWDPSYIKDHVSVPCVKWWGPARPCPASISLAILPQLQVAWISNSRDTTHFDGPGNKLEGPFNHWWILAHLQSTVSARRTRPKPGPRPQHWNLWGRNYMVHCSPVRTFSWNHIILSETINTENGILLFKLSHNLTYLV